MKAIILGMWQLRIVLPPMPVRRVREERAVTLHTSPAGTDSGGTVHAESTTARFRETNTQGVRETTIRVAVRQDGLAAT